MTNKYDRLGIVSIEQVREWKKVTPRNVKVEWGGVKINVESQRVQLFLTKGLKCKACSRVGVYFAIERIRYSEQSPNSYHLNLYSEDGTLFTKDHIIPLSKGGPNRFANLQTMCYDCNHNKGCNL